MSAIKPAVRHSVPELLNAIAGIELGECEPDPIVEWRRMMAMSVVASVAQGDENDLALGDMAVADLAGAIMVLCQTQDGAVVDGFISA